MGRRPHPGWEPDRLRAWRHAYGLTLEGAGERLRTLAEAAGVPVPAGNFQTLWQHESGTVYPGRPYRAAYCLLYRASEAELGFRPALPGEKTRDPTKAADDPSGPPEVVTSSTAQVGQIDSEPTAGLAGSLWPHDDELSSATALWGADMERRSFLIDSAFVGTMFATSAMRWLTHIPGAANTREGPVRIGVSDVDAIRGVTRALKEFDNKFGGGQLRSTVVHYLHTEIAPLLRNGAYDDSLRPRLFGAVAELTQLAGWMAYDLEQHGLAQRYLTQALRFASEANDQALGGEILAGMSHQSTYLGHPREAVDLARAAHQSAIRARVPKLMAEASVLEAHCHAMIGDASACYRSLNKADHEFLLSDRTNQPEWLGYFDEAYLSAKFAQSLRELGRLEEAEQHATRSLDMDRRFVRGETLNTVLLATIHARKGEIDRACDGANKALSMVRGLRSERTLHCFRNLARNLEPYSSTPTVRDFKDAASDVLAPTTGYSTGHTEAQ